MAKCVIFDLDGTVLDTISTITYYVNKTLEGEGLSPVREEDCKYFKECVKNAKTIEAVWCDNASGASWSYKTDIPHETFNIYEDGELFCVGIVFSVEDL